MAPLRKEAAHVSEQVSQVLLGEWLLGLDTHSEWSKVETEHGYEGWIRSEQVEVQSREQFQTWMEQIPAIGRLEMPRRHALFGEAMLTAGCLLNRREIPMGMEDHFQKLGTAPALRLRTDFTQEWAGIPYLWGGRSAWGLDCSGLVQALFNQQGFSFPRDAWQQAEMGQGLDFHPEKPEFEFGDLLFFARPGKRIHHVAISLGGTAYFHAAEWTRENDLDPGHPRFVQDRRDTLVQARRIQQSDLSPLLSQLHLLAEKAGS